MGAAIRRLAMKLKTELDIKDRTWNLDTYRDCFVGSDAVAAIIKLGFAENEEDAIKFGSDWIKCGVIKHVIGGNKLKNSKTNFYTFDSVKVVDYHIHYEVPLLRYFRQIKMNVSYYF